MTKESGETESYVTIFPIFSTTGFKPTTFNWQIIDVNSNFKNAQGFQSMATATFVGQSNTSNPIIKVNQIQDGEVIFINLFCELSDGATTKTSNSNQVAYRGDPINTAFTIFYSRNGKLTHEVVYDSPIELQILTANFDARGVFPNVGETAQGIKQTIGEHLFDLESIDTTKDLSSLSNANVRKQTKNGQETKVKTINFSFVKDENLFYAHGRSLDDESIGTLLHQNPVNSFHTHVEREADPSYFMKAIDNKRTQNPGFNSFINPMLNPAMPVKTSVKLFFPGRSGHGANGPSNQGCGNTTTVPGGCPSYPASANNSSCNSSSNTSQGFCTQSPCP